MELLSDEEICKAACGLTDCIPEDRPCYDMDCYKSIAQAQMQKCAEWLLSTDIRDEFGIDGIRSGRKKVILSAEEYDRIQKIAEGVDPDEGLELSPEVKERLERSKKLPHESLLSATEMRKQLAEGER
jgi:hypothetical protein